MRALIAMLLCGLAAPAHAVDLGATFSLELGNVRNDDPNWDLFSDANGMPSRGLRGGVRLDRYAAVQAGWHRVSRGSEVYVPSVSGSTFDDGGTFAAAWIADQITIGGQLGYPVTQWLFPYASADAMLLRATVKLDDDLGTKQNAGQVSAAGAAPGGLFMGGIELRTPSESIGIQGAWFLEVGYAVIGRVDLGTVGDMKPGGASVRSGIGVRF